MATIDLKDFIVKQLDDLKMEDIIVIDTSKTSSLADQVIIGSGRSGKQVESAMENLRTRFKDKGLAEGRIAGTAQDGWIVYDLGNIIVHLFVPEVRDIYRLEELFNPKSKKLTKKTKES